MARFTDEGTTSRKKAIQARRIYGTIQSDYRKTLQKFYNIKGRVANERTGVAHPKVSVADLRGFVEVEFEDRMLQPIRTILMELETMVIRNEDGILRRLFTR